MREAGDKTGAAVLENESPSVVLQPFAQLSVIGQNHFNSIPECFGVVHLFSVAQFMDNDIIQNPGRRQHKPPVKIQISFGRAASPAGFLVPYRDGTMGYADDVFVVGHSGRKVFFGGLPVTVFQLAALGLCEI